MTDMQHHETLPDGSTVYTVPRAQGDHRSPFVHVDTQGVSAQYYYSMAALKDGIRFTTPGEEIRLDAGEGARFALADGSGVALDSASNSASADFDPQLAPWLIGLLIWGVRVVLAAAFVYVTLYAVRQTASTFLQQSVPEHCGDSGPRLERVADSNLVWSCNPDGTACWRDAETTDSLGCSDAPEVPDTPVGEFTNLILVGAVAGALLLAIKKKRGG